MSPHSSWLIHQPFEAHRSPWTPAAAGCVPWKPPPPPPGAAGPRRRRALSRGCPAGSPRSAPGGSAGLAGTLLAPRSGAASRYVAQLTTGTDRTSPGATHPSFSTFVCPVSNFSLEENRQGPLHQPHASLQPCSPPRETPSPQSLTRVQQQAADALFIGKNCILFAQKPQAQAFPRLRVQRPLTSPTSLSPVSPGTLPFLLSQAKKPGQRATPPQSQQRSPHRTFSMLKLCTRAMSFRR